MTEQRDKTITLKLNVWRELKKISAEEELSLSQVVEKLLEMNRKRRIDDGKGAFDAGKPSN